MKLNLNEHVASLKAAKTNGTVPITYSTECFSKKLKGDLCDANSGEDFSTMEGKVAKKIGSNLFVSPLQPFVHPWHISLMR